MTIYLWIRRSLRHSVICRSILVSEFHSRHILVVAEGVEKKEEFEYLTGLGADLFQGFYLARPA